MLISFMAPEWSWVPAWTTGTVHTLASGIYADKAFDRMPILADALQDADCDESLILDPLRDVSREWFRGCRVLDCILGKRL